MRRDGINRSLNEAGGAHQNSTVMCWEAHLSWEGKFGVLENTPRFIIIVIGG